MPIFYSTLWTVTNLSTCSAHLLGDGDMTTRPSAPRERTFRLPLWEQTAALSTVKGMPDAASSCKWCGRLRVWPIKQPFLGHGSCQEFLAAKRSFRTAWHARPAVFDLVWAIARTRPECYLSNIFAFICKAWNLFLKMMLALQKVIMCCKWDFWSLDFFESFPRFFILCKIEVLSFSFEFLFFPVPAFVLFSFTPQSPAQIVSPQRCPGGRSAAPRHVSPHGMSHSNRSCWALPPSQRLCHSRDRATARGINPP